MSSAALPVVFWSFFVACRAAISAIDAASFDLFFVNRKFTVT